MSREIRTRISRPFNPDVAARRDPTLLQKKSGHWYVRFRHRNRTKSLSLGLRTRYLPADFRADASNAGEYVHDGKRYYPRDVYEKYNSDFRTPYIRGILNPFEETHDLTLQEAKEQYLRRFEKKKTRQHNESVLGLLQASIDEPRVRLKDVGPADVQLLLDSPSLKSGASRKNYWRHLRAFFNWAVTSGFLRSSENPILHVTEPAAPRKGRIFFVYPEEYERVLEEVDNDFRNTRRRLDDDIVWVKPVFDLALSLGLRREEIAAMQWQDVALDLGTVEIRRKEVDHDGFHFEPKGGRMRRVWICTRARRTLEQLRERRPDAGPLDRVVVSPETDMDGRPLPANVEKASAKWRKYRRDAGIRERISLHGLRHLFVTYNLLLDHSPYAVQLAVGHESLQVTMQYAQFSQQLVAPTKRKEFQERLVALGFDPPSRGYSF